MSFSWYTRAETPADIPVIHEVNLQAFGKHFEPDLIGALRANPAAWIPELSIVATTPDGEIAGYALLTRCRVDQAPVLSLGPVAVLPSYQRQGAGSAAVTAALARARELGERTVVVLGHAEYYPRFGFRQATEFGIHHPEFDGPNMMALSLAGSRMPTGMIRYPADWGV